MSLGFKLKSIKIFIFGNFETHNRFIAFLKLEIIKKSENYTENQWFIKNYY